MIMFWQTAEIEIIFFLLLNAIAKDYSLMQKIIYLTSFLLKLAENTYSIKNIFKLIKLYQIKGRGHYW